jgi:hypothetical protein
VKSLKPMMFAALAGLPLAALPAMAQTTTNMPPNSTASDSLPGNPGTPVPPTSPPMAQHPGANSGGDGSGGGGGSGGR